MGIVKKCRHGRGLPAKQKERAWRRCSCTWYADIRRNGKREYLALGSDRREAQRAYKELAATAPPPVAGSGRAFEDVADRWFSTKAGLRPASIHAYRYRLVHAKAYLGRTPVEKVTAALLAEMEGDLIAGGMSPRYARDVRRAALMVLGHAADAGLIDSVPRSRSRRAAHRPERPWFTPEELQRLWDAPVPDVGPKGVRRRPEADYLSLFRFAAVTGMRIGELLALTPEYVDHDAQVVKVRVALDSKSQTIGPPKTNGAARDIDVPASALDLLPDVGPTDRYWPVQYPAVLRNFHERLDAAGLPRCGLHSLRHSNVAVRITLLRQDLLYVARQIGHADPAITLREYGHLIPPPKEEAEALAVMLHGAGPS